MNHARALFLGGALLVAACGTSTLDVGHDPPPQDSATGPAAPAEKGNTSANAPWMGASAAPPAWEWLNPRPQGNTLRAVWGTANDDLWLVGDADTIVHWDGSEWRRVDAGTHGASFDAVWASSARDLWVAGRDGQPLLKHWDGASWSKNLAGAHEVTFLWGTSAHDVWSLTPFEVAHFDGASFRTTSIPGPSALVREIWGAAPNDVWGVGDHGTVLHWDGAAWSRMGATNPGAADDPFLDSYGYAGVWGSAADDVWAAFETPFVSREEPGVTGFAHWDGASWRIVQTVANQWPGPVVSAGQATETGHRIWGTDAANVIAAVGGIGAAWHWDGVTWSPAPFQTTTSPLAGTELVDVLGVPALFGASPDGVVAAGTAGRMMRFDATAPKDDPNGPWRDVSPGVHDDLVAVSVIGEGDAWAAGRAQVLHWTAGGWSARLTRDVVTASGATRAVSFTDVHARVADDVWVAAEGASDPHAVSYPEGYALHWDGRQWGGATSFTRSIRSVWSPGPADAWAVGFEAGLYHWNGSTWTTVASPNADVHLTSVRGSRADDVWFAGVVSTARDDGRLAQSLSILHWDGATLAELYRGADTGWVAGSDPRVFVRGTRDVWVTDLSQGAPVHWDGRRFARVDFGLPPFAEIHAIWSLTAEDLWLVSGNPGQSTTIRHFDGKTLSEAQRLTASGVAIGGAGGDALWIVGSGGATLRYRSGGTSPR
jgi:hypothetical protein